ncbi:MAG: dTMP kinase [Pseudomonadota bacterium]
MRAGRFITFEGLEGVGKTTALKMLVEALERKGVECVQTREPGGTAMAEKIRELVLAHHDESVSETTELLMMFAARSQNVQETIRPAIELGQWVISDRFTDATFAYQGYGRGFSFEPIQTLSELVHPDLWPDATILLEASEETMARRLKHRKSASDRIEAERVSFFRRVAKGYTELATASPERFYSVDANEDIDGVRQQINRIAEDMIARWWDL